MKKVYGSKIIFSILGSFTAVLWVGSLRHHFVGPYHPLVILGTDILMLILFLFYLRGILFPWWTYDESSFEKRGLTNINSKKKYQWVDVTSIFFTRGPTSALVNYLIFIDGREILSINFISTGNHLRVLSDVVRLVKMNNSKVKIEPELLKRIERFKFFRIL